MTETFFWQGAFAPQAAPVCRRWAVNIHLDTIEFDSFHELWTRTSPFFDYQSSAII